MLNLFGKTMYHQNRIVGCKSSKQISKTSLMPLAQMVNPIKIANGMDELLWKKSYERAPRGRLNR